VWLGSGQSNMAWRVKEAKNFEVERLKAKLPNIRMFTVPRRYATEPQSDSQGRWVLVSPETIGELSATLFFFGRELHRSVRVPFGLINSSVGGTPIQSWMSGEAQEATPQLAPFLDLVRKARAASEAPTSKPDAGARPSTDAGARATVAAARTMVATGTATAAVTAGKRDAGAPAAAPIGDAAAPTATPPRSPRRQNDRYDIAGLFNGMVAPLVPYGMRGAIWYQGESNARPEWAPYYETQLRLLVRDWRGRWGLGDFPFAWVQLPNFRSPDNKWCEVRDAMLSALSLPRTGMAVTIDIGEPDDIHPKNKQEVGRRLSLWALATVYGKGAGRPWSGPLPDGHEIRGREVVVSFTHAQGGLVARGGAPRGWLLAGADKRWVPAQARIKDRRVIVSSPDIPAPRWVRYAWQDLPDGNLYNRAGLPASPFRTDE